MNLKIKKMETLEIRNTSIKVQDQTGAVLLVARYEDENGIYFLDENLKKQYAVIKTPIKMTEEREIKDELKDELKEYRFNVEFEHKGRSRGWDQKETKVIAKSYEEAIEKVKNSFKNIFEISEL